MGSSAPLARNQDTFFVVAKMSQGPSFTKLASELELGLAG
jgi:hypothetical protein